MTTLNDWRGFPTAPVTVALLLATATLTKSMAQATSRPVAIEAFVTARESLFSGVISWTYRNHRELADREFLHVNRYAANGDMMFEERGDQDAHKRLDKNRRFGGRAAIVAAHESQTTTFENA